MYVSHFAQGYLHLADSDQKAIFSPPVQLYVPLLPSWDRDGTWGAP